MDTAGHIWSECRGSGTSLFGAGFTLRICHDSCVILLEWDVLREDWLCKQVRITYISGVKLIRTLCRYVPHANKALRSLNMYLNVRQPPLRSKLPFSPFAFLFPRTSPASSPTPISVSASTSSRRRSPSPQRASKRSSSVPIAPIPPSSNPRGELIFSSRVDKAFRDSYERFRNAWERRREARENVVYQATWLGWICVKILRIRRPLVFANLPVGPGGTGGGSGTATPLGRAGSLAGSVRGRGSASVTPSSSRRSSPVPSRITRSRNSLLGGNAQRTGTPPDSVKTPSTVAEGEGTSGQVPS